MELCKNHILMTSWLIFVLVGVLFTYFIISFAWAAICILEGLPSSYIIKSYFSTHWLFLNIESNE